MTGDEMRERNIALMGEALGKQYSELFREVTVLHLYWNEYVELFGTSDERIARLNQTAPGFFLMLQEQLFEANMLHLARLTDRSVSLGKSNLTIQSLPDLVSDPALKIQLTTLVDDVKHKTEFCRDWRNRRLAHHDLLLAMKDAQAKPLEDATKEKIAAALRALSDLLNAMERFYYKNVCSFEDTMAHHGVGTLLFYLGHGIKGRERMMERFNQRDFSALDVPEPV